jgi:FtsP/CotA-like multicopper oxidase with cupredoxin domain
VNIPFLRPRPRPKADADPLLGTVPLDNPGLTGSGPADQVFDLHFNFTVENRLAFIVNNITYKAPKLPSLLKVLSGASTTEDFDPTEHALIIKPGSIVELNIFGFPEHPFHLQCVDLFFWGGGGGLRPPFDKTQLNSHLTAVIHLMSFKVPTDLPTTSTPLAVTLYLPPVCVTCYPIYANGFPDEKTLDCDLRFAGINKPITIRFIADNPGPWLFHCHIGE